MIIVRLVFMSFSLSESLHSWSPSEVGGLGGVLCLTDRRGLVSISPVSSGDNRQNTAHSWPAPAGLPEQEQDLL